MYSMVAFGLVVGFLLGGYFITMHENSFGTGHIPADIYPGHPKWIGAWWCGFVLLGILLILVCSTLCTCLLVFVQEAVVLCFTFVCLLLTSSDNED